MLGDACHPMIPFMGQGGAQAIEDAAAITACLLQCGDDVEAALKLYETVRLPRATQIQNGSWDEQDPVPHARRTRPGGARRAMAKGMTDWSYKRDRLGVWPRRRRAGRAPKTAQIPGH